MPRAAASSAQPIATSSPAWRATMRAFAAT